MNDLLNYIESLRDKVWLIGKIEFESRGEWTIRIDQHTPEGDIPLVEVSSCDMALCFAKAQVDLKDKMAEHFGWF